jgi:hypothetical protein
MKTRLRRKGRTTRASQALRLGHCVTGASLLVCGAHARAADTNSAMTAEQRFEGGTNTFNNWVEFSVGGLMNRGSTPQAEQRYRLNTGPFGGIEDLHLQQTVATNTTLSIDGRAIFDIHDYKLSLALKREEFGFLRFNYQNFRTWYNGAGGYYPPNGLQYALSDDALTLDRGEISFEAGLALKDIPKITFKYTHGYRDGEKSSTIWGPVHPDTSTLVRGLYPGFYDIDEKVDSFQLDVAHHIKATEFGVGVRYDKGDLNNSLNTTLWQGEPVQRDVTDKQGTTYDLLSVHAFTETWIKKNLFFSSGFLFANLDNTFSGSRVYGDDFDVGYVPNALNGLGYFDLNGGSHEQEYVLNLNLMATPFKDVSIVPSVRVQKIDWNADSSGTGTLGEDTGPFSSTSDRDALDVRERLDVRYTGMTNWVFFGGGEWTEGDGNLKENGGLSQINGIGVAPIQRETDDTRFFQKYSLGARWYPTRKITVGLGGYYKDNQYDYTHTLDSTPNDSTSFNRYPAYLVMQGFQTYDGNVALTFRPIRNVTLVTRYEYQWSTVHTQPDSASGLSDVETAQIPSQIIAQNISWVPWSRLSLQVGFNYVLSETRTPASDYTQAILAAQNNYWTLNFSSVVVLDDKTDLNLGYFFYRADDYDNNSSAGVPLGAGAEEQTVTAMLSRRLTERIRLNLKYGYTHYTDWASGGNNDFDAQVVFASMQYRF